MTDRVACVVGVGPGLGYSLTDKFRREGFDVGMMARSESSLERFEEELEHGSGTVESFECDARVPESVSSAFRALEESLGVPSVLIYNAGTFTLGGIMDIEPERFEECWQANCYGGYLCARQVLPEMKKEGEGTILFTGATASLRGSEGFSTLAVGKFGLRALAQSMAREFGPDGIHVGHVIIDGQIATPANLEEYPERERETFLDPDKIARQYWELHQQDRSTWTLELDLRPYVEEF